MKKNMGSVDRIIRVVVAALIAILYFSGKIDGTKAIILGVAAIVFLLTSFINFCPLYTILGINTDKKDT